MPFIILLFCAGIFFYYFIDQYPVLLILIGMFGIISYQLKLIKLWLAFCCGVAWIFIYIAWQNIWTLPLQLEGVPTVVIGTIAKIPQINVANSNFLFSIDQFAKPLITLPHSILIQCVWQNSPKLVVGDKWELHIKLKKLHSSLNPGGFDYEAWAFAHGILATAVVNPQQQNIKLTVAKYAYAIDRIRQNLAEKIDLILHPYATKGLIKALIVGEQSTILPQQWQVLRQTGTNHLFAIAGLHVGFLAKLISQLTAQLTRRFFWLTVRIPMQLVADVTALFSALIYCGLAGFSLPTKRAVIMLAVFLIAKVRRYYVGFWHSWIIALGFILLLNPLQILTESFWLSFIAVGSLIYGFYGRIKLHPAHFFTKLLHSIKAQWITGVALIPVTLLLFQQASLVSFLGNFIAIPWIGFIVAPLSLFSGLLLLNFPTLGAPLLKSANFLLASFWPILQKIGNMPNSQWYQVIANPWLILFTVVAILLLLAPKGFPGRWLAFIWLLPLIFYSHKPPKFGEVNFNLLDVGQGLSAVVRTHSHVLIFDTGAHRNQGFDAGESILIPFLRWFHINHVNTLMISHGDNDHIGGAAALLHALPVDRIITSVPKRFNVQNVFTCLAGQSWRWDGIKFEVLSPLFGSNLRGNNSSCVLKVTTPLHSILLTGDIEKEAEKVLLNNAAAKLYAEVLVAPHHGSKTSSTEAFINAVHPQVVLFPIGYRNQYHLPTPMVVERYKAAAAKVFDSVECGAIEIELKLIKKFPVHCYRHEHHHFWRAKFLA